MQRRMVVVLAAVVLAAACGQESDGGVDAGAGRASTVDAAPVRRISSDEAEAEVRVAFEAAAESTSYAFEASYSTSGFSDATDPCDNLVNGTLELAGAVDVSARRAWFAGDAGTAPDLIVEDDDLWVRRGAVWPGEVGWVLTEGMYARLGSWAQDRHVIGLDPPESIFDDREGYDPRNLEGMFSEAIVSAELVGTESLSVGDAERFHVVLEDQSMDGVDDEAAGEDAGAPSTTSVGGSEDAATQEADVWVVDGVARRVLWRVSGPEWMLGGGWLGDEPSRPTGRAAFEAEVLYSSLGESIDVELPEPADVVDEADLVGLEVPSGFPG